MGYFRILLALGVVLFHTGSLFSYTGINGIVAVHIFFIISGFYMALILKNKYAQTKHPYYTFLTNRFFRIYPIYEIVLLISICESFLHISHFNISSILMGMYSMFPNYISARHGIGAIEDVTLLVRFDYFSPAMLYNNLPFVSPAWTLILELLFYIIAPFLILFKKRYIFLLTLVFLCIHFLTSHFYTINGKYVSDYFFLSNLFFFLFGIISYYFYMLIKEKSIHIKYSFLLSCAFLVIILLWNYFPESKFHWIIIKEWSMYFLTPIVIPLLFDSFKNVPLNNFFADLSYPVYITHFSVIDFLHFELDYASGEKYFTLWTLCITLVFSILLVYLIEKPIDRYRQRRIKILTTVNKLPRISKTK